MPMRAGGSDVRMRSISAILSLLLVTFGLVASHASAQYTGELPPGVISVEVDGQPIDSLAIPTTNFSTPTISGRVDPGASSVALAIANGDILRFEAAVNESGRFRTPTPQALADGQYALYVNDLLVGAFNVAGGAGAARQPGQLLDIARVVPYPADAAQSLPNLGFLDGRFYSLAEEAQRSAANSTEAAVSSRDIERQLAEAGWLQRYDSRLAVPNADNPKTFDVQMSSFVIEYASGADAKAALDALVGAGDTEEFPRIGDDSVLTAASGVTPDTGAPYQAARLIFRVGPMLVLIVYADLLNRPPDLNLLQTVAEAVAARGAFVAERQVNPLGSMVLRLDSANAQDNTRFRDFYEIRGGALTSLFNEDPAARDARIALLTGTTDAFTATTRGVFVESARRRGEDAPGAQETVATTSPPTSVISIEGEASATAPVATAETQDATAAIPPPTADVEMTSTLYAFPADADADAWLNAQRASLAESNEIEGAIYTELADAPALADDAAMYSVERAVTGDGPPLRGFRIYTRTGSIIAVLDIESDPEIALRGAVGLMEQQLSCLREQGCSGSVALPGSVFGERERAANANADPADAQGTPESP